MTLSKIQAESMNLADTYAFSGTVSGTSVAGSNAFAARNSGSSWVAASANAIVVFDNDSTGDSFDTDGVFNTSTYKFVTPATGVYTFWYGIYSANTDQDNAFTFYKNSASIAMTVSGKFSHQSNQSDDHMQTATVIINLTSGDTISVHAQTGSDYYQGLIQWGGCRLA